MALTYTQSGASDALTWGSVGTVLAGLGCYKDLAITGCGVGDLLVALGGAEGNQFAGGTSDVSTTAATAGTTGTWTPVDPSVVTGADTDVVLGRAVVTGAGTVTVRVRTQASSADHMGAGVVRIPAGEWNPAGTFYTQTFVGDADGQASLVIGGTGTYTVVYLNTDWNGTARSSTAYVPSGGTRRSSYQDAGRYSADIATWTAQAVGTRSYGTSGIAGQDASGVILAIPESGGGASPQTVIPTGIATAVAAGTPTITTAVTVNPAGVPTAAAAGSPTVSTATTVSPSGIPTAAVPGTPTLTTSVTVGPTGIASAAVAGTPAVTMGTIVSPTGIPSAAAAGTPTVTTSVTVTPTGIPSAASAGTPSASTVVTVVPDGIPSAAATGTPTVMLAAEATVEITRVALTVVPAAAVQATVEITRVALTVVPAGGVTPATVEITGVRLIVTPPALPATVEITGVRLHVTPLDAPATVEITRVALRVVAAVVSTYTWQERVAGMWVDPDWKIMERRAGVWVPLDG